MIQLLEKAVRSKSFLTFMLLMPLCWIIIDMLIDPFRANPLQELLISTGESAVWLLVLLLWISPLRMIFPGFTILRSLQSQKRILGLGIFFYVLLHFSHLFGGSCRSPGNRRGSVSGLSLERAGSLPNPVGNGFDQQQQENSTTRSETLENAPPCGLSCRGSDPAPYASQGKE